MLQSLAPYIQIAVTYYNCNGPPKLEENAPAEHDVLNPEDLEFNLWKTAIQAAVAKRFI